MVRALGGNTDLMILGLIITNGLVAMSGAIMAKVRMEMSEWARVQLLYLLPL